MIHIFRRHMQWMLVLVAAIVILAFVWFYNPANTPRIRADVAATAYGKPISTLAINTLARFHGLAREIGLYGLLAGLGAFDESDEARENFVWNLFVLRHECEQLDIAPTDNQVREAIQELPILQTDGAYDPARYVQLADQALPTRGFSTRQLHEIIRDQIRLQKLRGLVGATVNVNPEQARSIYRRQTERVQADVVRIKRDDFLAGADPKEEEVRAEFERRKDNLVTQAKRKVLHVRFQLAEEQKKLQGQERKQALQSLADRVFAFSEKMLDPAAKFAEVARQEKLELRETRLFTEADPDPDLAKIRGATDAAALLQPERPTSDPIEADDGYVILHLAAFEPSRPMTIDDARAQLVTSLRQQRAKTKMDARGGEIRAQLVTALSARKPFADAARALNLEAVSLAPFSLAEPPQDAPDAGLILDAVTGLQTRQLSQFVSDDNGGVLVLVQTRETPKTDVEEEQVSSLTRQLRFMRQTGAFQEWIRLRREAAAIRR